MQIEPATLEDARGIAEVHVASWQRAYQNILPEQYLADLSIERREKMWREALEKQLPQLLVARSENRTVGFVAFGASRDDGAKPGSAEIWAVYLLPEVWSQGVGRMLWQAALERMVAEGFNTVSLWVISTNERAIRFYLDAGFVPEPGSLKEFELGGVLLKEIRYVFSCPGQGLSERPHSDQRPVQPQSEDDPRHGADH